MPEGWSDWKAEQAKKRAQRAARQRAREAAKGPLFSSEEGRGSRILTGLVTAIAGVPSLMIGAGIWTIDNPAFYAPLSIILCLGFLFVGGGLSVALGAFSPELEADGSLPGSAPKAVRALQFFLQASAAAGLAGVGTWAVLGGKMHDLANLLGLIFVYADPAVLESRLKLWLVALACLLWLTALIGVARGLMRMRGDDAGTSANW
jgi:hypothetical protein